MKDKYGVVLRPIVTEKSHRLMENSGGRRRKGKAAARAYTFEVHSKANKIQIRKAIEDLFSVKVVDVNTQHVRPKLKRVGSSSGYTRSWKKAVVRLAPGHTIELY
jgi:large subunit ribosomal protein L23